jgi:hypothetical protein
VAREQMQALLAGIPAGGATTYPEYASMMQSTAEVLMNDLTAAMRGAPPNVLLNTVMSGVRSAARIPPAPEPPRPPNAIANFFARFNPAISSPPPQAEPVASAAEVVRQPFPRSFGLREREWSRELRERERIANERRGVGSTPLGRLMTTARAGACVCSPVPKTSSLASWSMLPPSPRRPPCLRRI